jgi:hypothetical protein
MTDRGQQRHAGTTDLQVAGEHPGVERHFDEIDPDRQWSGKKVEHLVQGVRARLSRGGVAGLTREEVREPVGNTLNHNLIGELMATTTLVPPDLRLIGYDG